MPSKPHWESIYQSTRADAVSWFEAEATASLRLIHETVPDRGAVVLDAGGGASTLVDGLLREGYRRVVVLDIARAALEQSRARLGSAAADVRWLEADVLRAPLASASIDLWHDRAVFHFLGTPAERRQYVLEAARVVRPGGHVVVASFAEGGPSRCSGLDVTRHTPESLRREFGDGFEAVTDEAIAHATPWGAAQAFIFCVFRRRPERTA